MRRFQRCFTKSKYHAFYRLGYKGIEKLGDHSHLENQQKNREWNRNLLTPGSVAFYGSTQLLQARKRRRKHLAFINLTETLMYESTMS